MPDINWGSLVPQVPQAQIIPLNNQSNNNNDTGNLLSGLASLVGHVQNNPVQTNSNAGTALNQYIQGSGTGSNLNPVRTSPIGFNGLLSNAQQYMGMTANNPTLDAYLQKANPGLDPTKTPWCAGFVGSVLNSSGVKGTGSLSAKSYLNFGQPTNSPSKGDIVVFNDLTGQNRPEHGHVGFVDHIDPKSGMVYTIGGNQHGSVSMQAYPISAVAGFRIPPTGQQVQQFAANNGIQSPQQLSKLPEQATNQILPHVMAGIAHVETGGSQNPYQERGPLTSSGDRAYGKYQILGSNISSWTKQALGYSMTPRQFLNDPNAQEKVAQYQVNQYLKQYKNADDVYSMWFSGRPANKAGNARDSFGTTVPQYINKAREGYRNSLMKVSLNNQPVQKFNETLQNPPQIPNEQFNSLIRQLDQGRDDYASNSSSDNLG